MTQGVEDDGSTFGRSESGPVQLLHVDDDPMFLELAAELLSRELPDVEVLTAESASAGLSILEETPVDCVVSDYDMPGTNGLSFLGTVRERHGDLPFILFTGKGSEEIASEAISASVTDYLQKESGTDQFAVLANRIEGYVDRKRTAEALAESRRRLSRLMGNLPGMVYRCGNEPDWPMEFVSDGCLDLSGYTTEALVSGEVHWGRDVIHPDDQGRIWEAVQAALADGEPFEVTYRITAADGETRLLWEQGVGIFDDGEVEAIEGFITDVTRREAIDADRKALAQRIEAIVEAAPEPIMALDREGRVTLWNEAAEETFGWQADEVLGEPLPIVPEDEVAEYRDLRDTVLGGQVIDAIEVVRTTRSGEEIEVSLSNAPVYGPEGEVVGSMAVVRDLTELREREREADFFRQLVEKVGIGVAVYGDDGRFVYVNDHLADMVGRQAADVVGTSLWEYNHGFDPDRLTDFWSSIAPGETKLYEVDLTSSDGTTVPVETLVTREDIQGTSYHFGTLRDVSRRLSLDAELRETADRLHAIIEASPEAIVAVDAAGEVTLWNAAAGQLFGTTTEAAIGSPESILPDPIAAVLDERRTASKSAGALSGGVLSFTAPGGDRIDVSISTAPLGGTDDETGGVMAVVADVTDQQDQERTVTRLHDATRELVAAAAPQDIADSMIHTTTTILGFPYAAVMLWDDEIDALRVVSDTPEARERTLSPPKIMQRGEGVCGTVFDTGQSAIINDRPTSEWTIVQEDTGVESACALPLGEHGVYVISSDEPNSFDDRDVDVANLLATNAEAALDRAVRVAELRERERQLERQNERLERFAGVLSHDLRNPLNVALGRLNMVSEEDEYYEAIAEAVERIGAIVEDVLAFARHGRVVDDPVPVALDEVVREAWSTVETAEASCSCTVTRQFAGDPVRIRRLLENLFRNAVEHAGPEVAVTVDSLPGGFAVEDDGPGIPPGDRESVFEFGHTTSASGTGFGLAIVKEIAEAHDWTIEVTAGSDGGARFEITGVEWLED